MSIGGGQAGFAVRLKSAMEAAQQTQSSLAKAIGADQPTVQKWVQPDGSLPAGKYMQKLPGVLGVSGHWLLTGEGSMTPVEGDRDEVFRRGVEWGWMLAREAAASALARGPQSTGATEGELGDRLLKVAEKVRRYEAGKPPDEPGARPRGKKRQA